MRNFFRRPAKPTNAEPRDQRSPEQIADPDRVLVDAIDAILNQRLATIIPNFMNVWRGQVESLLDQTTATPAFWAKTALDTLAENLDTMQRELVSEVRNKLSGRIEEMEAGYKGATNYQYRMDSRVQRVSNKLFGEAVEHLQVRLPQIERQWRARPAGDRPPPSAAEPSATSPLAEFKSHVQQHHALFASVYPRTLRETLWDFAQQGAFQAMASRFELTPELVDKLFTLSCTPAQLPAATAVAVNWLLYMERVESLRADLKRQCQEHIGHPHFNGIAGDKLVDTACDDLMATGYALVRARLAEILSQSPVGPATPARQ